MKKLLVPLLALLIVTPSYAATCNPNGSCNACKNCKYCKNCSERGGSCSVCRQRGTQTKPDEGHQHEDKEQNTEEE